ncbi:hypothetical protein LZZ90_02070 [Flavobacterium sp. SM15]|uniref:hypothetical protein n=1 Tax=Flavobacterium sp. SM15 TaxID=2908005 RepID=UPI001EDA02F7|nr:hypothetical protein [Flavobacterium sp. SM15]MCG2610290.1 hypothetical protein [Flavobacterium sp. SM15]
MKKSLLALLLTSFIGYSQVGIGTANPQSDLHIAGNLSTIRIEKHSAVNNPTLNNGLKPALAYVNANGDITLSPSGANGSSSTGLTPPINFLIDVNDFVPAGPLGYGTIINNSTAVTSSNGLITVVPFSSPQAALIEVKYGITVLFSSTDLNSAATPFNDSSARIAKVYFCIDLNNDGLDATELSKRYGLNGLPYSSFAQGILGYAYMNSHGYSSIPAGNHSLHFFGQINDGESKLTSVGYGGAKDFLKIRIYN